MQVNLVRFHAEGSQRRCISFGGDGQLRGGGLDVDQNGIMWLHYKRELGGEAVGASGLWRLPAPEAARLIKEGEAQAAATDPLQALRELRPLHVAGGRFPAREWRRRLPAGRSRVDASGGRTCRRAGRPADLATGHAPFQLFTNVTLLMQLNVCAAAGLVADGGDGARP